MRSRTIELAFVALVLMPLVLLSDARATQKQRTIIIALDQSGSMVRSDPGKLRVEAAGLLAATENPHDQVGLIAFGDTAHWLQQPIERDQFDFKMLDKVGSSDAHTSFSPVLRAVEAYLVGQPPSFFQDHDISLVLLTDGHSDPADMRADADRSRALSIAGENAWRLKVYTIGLGNDLDLDFLDQLARTSNGFSIQAASAADLPDAFLRVAARAAALPVYIRSSSSQNLTWAGTPDRVVVVFAGDHAASLQLPGNVLYRSTHVAVAEENPTAGAAKADWSGNGLVFLCVQEPLSLSPEGDFPVAMLTDAPHPLTLTLESRHGPVKNAFFLESASAHLLLAGRENETVPLNQEPGTSRFTGEMEARTAGDFRALAYLESPYGEIETYLGDLTAFVVPVKIPEQVSAGVFDPLPRGWFAKRLEIQPLLPVGTVNLQFSSDGVSDRLPPTLRVLPGQNPPLKMLLGGDPGLIHVVDYSATWSDGETTVTRHGATRVFVHQMSAGELIRAKWPWTAVALLLMGALVTTAWSFWPRPLQVDLIVRRNGAQVLRLRLPSQLRTRILHVSESQAGNSSGPSRAVIAGTQSRELLSLQSTRRGGRWTVVAHPQAAHAAAQQGRKWAEIDLRAIHVPVFSTEDGTIQINVLYS
ncbi:MAG: vWA domain-containing protein [Terriglobia bacterium]|nr:vWA domain-containing protein [Terriglobia bacterium]